MVKRVSYTLAYTWTSQMGTIQEHVVAYNMVRHFISLSSRFAITTCLICMCIFNIMSCDVVPRRTILGKTVQAQYCGKMQNLRLTLATLSSLRACRTLKWQMQIFHVADRPFRHFVRVARGKMQTFHVAEQPFVVFCSTK